MVNLDLINLNCPGARTGNFIIKSLCQVHKRKVVLVDADLSLKIRMFKTEIITPDYYAHFPIPLTGHFKLQKLFRWVDKKTLQKKLESETVEISLLIDENLMATYESNVWDFVFDQRGVNEIGQIYTQPGKKVLLKHSTSNSNLPVQLGKQS